MTGIGGIHAHLVIPAKAGIQDGWMGPGGFPVQPGMTACGVTPAPVVIPESVDTSAPAVIPAKAGIQGWFMRSLLAVAVGLALVTNVTAYAQGFEMRSWPASQPRPMLAATDLQGQHWDWAGLKGRAVLINFWASWCEPCLSEMPSLQQLARQQGPDRLVVLAVNFKEPEARIQRFVQQTGLDLPVLADPSGDLARAWGVRIFPSTVLEGADGRVRGVLRGELDWTSAAAQRLIQPLLRR